MIFHKFPSRNGLVDRQQCEHKRHSVKYSLQCKMHICFGLNTCAFHSNRPGKMLNIPIEKTAAPAWYCLHIDCISSCNLGLASLERLIIYPVCHGWIDIGLKWIIIWNWRQLHSLIRQTHIADKYPLVISIQWILSNHTGCMTQLINHSQTKNKIIWTKLTHNCLLVATSRNMHCSYIILHRNPILCGYHRLIQHTSIWTENVCY